MMNRKRLPLEGVRIADFCWVWAGPFACMLLAELGAEVIKVEGHRRTDLTRHTVFWPLPDPAPTLLKPNRGMSFNSVNMGKKSLTLDISQPEGAALARQVCAKSDIVIDNMRAGVMTRAGLGYEALRKVRPDIIVISSSSRGQEGPDHDFGGYATIHHAIGGASYATGYPDDAPSTTGGDTDLMNATTTAFAALAALYHRMQTGEGQFIDYSQCEGVTSYIGEMVLGYQMTGQTAERAGNRHPYFAPHSVYRCWGVDRWLALEIHSDSEFAALAKVIDRPELAEDRRFRTMRARKRNESALDRIIEEWTGQRDRDWMVNELCQAGLMAAPSRDWRDLYADPHLRARRAFVNVNHPEIGRLELVGVPWKMSDYKAPTRRAPLLGEHTDDVLRRILGLNAEQIAELRRKGIVM
jgi:benzylsuccinate CoA-transferase BbsF subunit